MPLLLVLNSNGEESEGLRLLIEAIYILHIPDIFFLSHLKMTLTFLNSKIPFWELKKGGRPLTIIYENICKNEAYFLNPLKIIFAHNDLLKHEGSSAMWYLF